MKLKMITLAAGFALIIGSPTMAEDAIVSEEDATEESVTLTLPEEAAEEGHNNAARGLDTANEARERRQDFGRDTATDARSRRDSAPTAPVPEAPAGRP
jgi:hypothetical protein